MDKRYRIEVRGYDLVLGEKCKLIRYKPTRGAALKMASELKTHMDRPGVTMYTDAKIREYQWYVGADACGYLYVRSIPVP